VSGWLDFAFPTIAVASEDDAESCFIAFGPATGLSESLCLVFLRVRFVDIAEAFSLSPKASVASRLVCFDILSTKTCVQRVVKSYPGKVRHK
jgi:hypothetical protein